MLKKDKVKIPLPIETDSDKYKLVFENERVLVYDYTDLL